jgi:hypothetical protein
MMSSSHRFLLAKSFLGGVAKGGFVGGAIGTTISVFMIIHRIENDKLQLAHRLRRMDERAYEYRQDNRLLAKELVELRKVVDEGRKN